MRSISAAGASEVIREVAAASATEQHHNNTTNMAGQLAPDVPDKLRSMIQLNPTYGVLICPHDRCRKAVRPSALTRHSHDEHRTTIRARQDLDAFIKKLAWKYDSQTVRLPPDGCKAQPIIPVGDGVECLFCIAESRQPTFKTRKQKSMRKMLKKHGNKVHKRYEVPDEELFREIRVQTWFRGNGEARCWRVDEGDEVAEVMPVVHGGSGMVGFIDEEGTRATDDTTNTIANAHEPVDTREGARAAVIVVDSDDEDFVRREEVPIRAAEGDNRDESVSTPEKESTATAVDIDSDDELLVLT
jgi:hypothetical protein